MSAGFPGRRQAGGRQAGRQAAGSRQAAFDSSSGSRLSSRNGWVEGTGNAGRIQHPAGRPRVVGQSLSRV